MHWTYNKAILNRYVYPQSSINKNAGSTNVYRFHGLLGSHHYQWSVGITWENKWFTENQMKNHHLCQHRPSKGDFHAELTNTASFFMKAGFRPPDSMKFLRNYGEKDAFLIVTLVTGIVCSCWEGSTGL